MNNQRISFAGSPSHLSARNFQAGQCYRAVNLRYNNGSLMPVNSTPIIAALGDAERLLCYVHKCSDIQHVISLKGLTVYHDLDMNEHATTNINRELITLDTPLTDVQSVGNTLILITQSDVYYLLYGVNGYKILGTQPPMPRICFHSHTERNEDILIPELSIHGKFYSLSDDNYTTFYNHVIGQYYQLRDNIHQDRLFLQPIIVRYALRLYDGSHILPSPPVLLGYINKKAYNEEKTTLMDYRENTDESIFRTFTLAFDAYSLYYTLLYNELEEWSDIVTGIDIFASKEIPILIDKPTNTSYTKSNGNNNFTITFKLPVCEDKKLTEYVTREGTFYHLATISPDAAASLESKPITHDIHPDELIYRPTLIADSSNFNRWGAKHSYVYNNRLHLADVTLRYYEGYPALLFSHTFNRSHNHAIVYTRTTIKQPNGEKNYAIASTSIPYFDYRLTPIISYPDINAVSMEIVIRHEGTEYRHTFDLKSCDYENRASYVHNGIEDLQVDTWEHEAVTEVNLPDFITSSSSFTRQLNNRLMVSKINNPFSFPDAQYYNISDGNIVGIAAVTTALSQGQYGEFPLYIFTDRGIWSMRNGDEIQCYSQALPINNTKVDNRLPVTPIEQAIIFRSGDNIYSITGSQCSVLLPLSESMSSAIEVNLNTILPDCTEAHTDSNTLTNYFNGYTKIAYNYNLQEMIFYNDRHNYCIVLHIPSGHLYRRERTFRHIIDAQGKLMAQGDNNALYDLYNESEAFVEITLVTHPLQFTPDTYTRLRQLMWRMKCDYTHIESIITAAHEPEGQNNITHRLTYQGYIAGHLPIRHTAPPFKFYRFILNGVVSSDFRLDCADVAYDVVENNKLR
ncbi:MAG: hypothetical protein IKM35_00895 [Bacteroidaceae bacterium]|nr:hypothetical protein [Bacteroidaceae bacterium]